MAEYSGVVCSGYQMYPQNKQALLGLEESFPYIIEDLLEIKLNSFSSFVKSTPRYLHFPKMIVAGKAPVGVGKVTKEFNFLFLTCCNHGECGAFGRIDGESEPRCRLFDCVDCILHANPGSGSNQDKVV